MGKAVKPFIYKILGVGTGYNIIQNILIHIVSPTLVVILIKTIEKTNIYKRIIKSP